MKSESRREENIHLSHAFWAPWIAIKSYCCTFLEKEGKSELNFPKFILSLLGHLFFTSAVKCRFLEWFNKDFA